MNERTAERYMQCARWAKDKSDILSELTPAAVYQLAAPSTPRAIQDAVLARVAAGERIKVTEINSLCSNARYEAKEEARREEDAARLARISPRSSRLRTTPKTAMTTPTVRTRTTRRCAAHEHENAAG
jgi:hypothetical protein